jgi:hypothetical protein
MLPLRTPSFVFASFVLVRIVMHEKSVVFRMIQKTARPSKLPFTSHHALMMASLACSSYYRRDCNVTVVSILQASCCLLPILGPILGSLSSLKTLVHFHCELDWYIDTFCHILICTSETRCASIGTASVNYFYRNLQCIWLTQRCDAQDSFLSGEIR